MPADNRNATPPGATESSPVIVTVIAADCVKVPVKPVASNDLRLIDALQTLVPLELAPTPFMITSSPVVGTVLVRFVPPEVSDQFVWVALMLFQFVETPPPTQNTDAMIYTPFPGVKYTIAVLDDVIAAAFVTPGGSDIPTTSDGPMGRLPPVAPDGTVATTVASPKFTYAKLVRSAFLIRIVVALVLMVSTTRAVLVAAVIETVACVSGVNRLMPLM